MGSDSVIGLEKDKYGHTINVTGFVQEQPLSFVVDTGATDTIISERSFKSIPSGSRPTLQPMYDTGAQADGSPLPIVGWASMRVRIGTVEVEIPVTVAHIKNDDLIGVDFLSLTECVIDTRRKQLNFGEEVVQVYTEENRLFCANITVSKRFDIPPGHERVILGRINKLPDMQGFGVVEPATINLRTPEES